VLAGLDLASLVPAAMNSLLLAVTPSCPQQSSRLTPLKPSISCQPLRRERHSDDRAMKILSGMMINGGPEILKVSARAAGSTAMFDITVRQSLRHLAELVIAEIFVQTADRSIEATLLKSVPELSAPICVVYQQNIGKRDTIRVPHFAVRSVLCCNVVSEELLCHLWRMNLKRLGHASRGDALSFVFNDP
jgi:hypothetical protein